jgi:replicative DNA helicase
MSDLDGSGQVEQAARLIAFLQQHRNADGTTKDTGSLHVVKVTGGSPCSVNLRWDGPSMTWWPK